MSDDEVKKLGEMLVDLGIITEKMRHLESENARLLKQVERMREALEAIIPTAESYAMQTYDRSGCTRRVIEQAKSALEGEK